ncbi:MAG: hypothetical protein R2792_13515 [Saprospiraceae bacterium]
MLRTRTKASCKLLVCQYSPEYRRWIDLPTMLAENVVNDGSQLVIVPNNVTNQARVRVDAADNVF